MADTIKCPNCGSNIVFDADHQKLTCGSCGTVLDVKDIDTVLEGLQSSNLNDENVVEYVCNSCGAKVVTDKNTSASFCAFCGSPALIGQKLSHEFEPQYIIPFKFGRDNAVEKFLDWCKGGRMTPFGFVSDMNIEKLTGLYVPYWLSDYETYVNIEGKGIRYITERDGTRYKESRKLIREVTYTWNNVPFDAEKNIDDALMEAIEPFDFDELISFDYKYLPGFFADSYDLTADDLKDRIEKLHKEYSDEEMKIITDPYHTIEYDELEKKLSHKEKYALLPVWFLNYRYLDKTYTFIMNGQTGEVAGIPPVSLVKRIVMGVGILALLAIIVKAITSLILWGVVG